MAKGDNGKKEKNLPNTDIKPFEEVSPFYIFFNISKQSNKCYILFDKQNKTFTQNLSCWYVYDYWRKKKSRTLCKAILGYITEKYGTNNEIYDTKIKSIYSLLVRGDLTDKRFCETVLIDYEKDIYNLFQTLISHHKVIIKDTDYKPVNKLIYEKNGDNYLNLYKKGDKFKDVKPDITKKFDNIKRLIYNICGNDDSNYNYFINFLAYKIQNPETLVPCHIIIRDNGGTGKTEILLSDILKTIFEVSIITQDDLMSSFNSYMVGSSFVWCEEVEGFNDEKKLKALTGAQYVTLNEKFEKNKKVRNYNNFIIASNELRVLKISENDRRFSVIGGGDRLVPNKPGNWGETIFKDKNECKTFFESYKKNFETEIRNFYGYLLALKVERIDVSVPLDNCCRTDLINLNKPSEINFLDDLIDLKLDGLYREIYPSRDINVWGDLIIVKDSETESSLNGYWVKGSDIYELYVDYCKKNNYNKSLSRRMFSRRIEESKRFKEIFTDYKVIRIADDFVARCFRFKSKKKVKEE